MAVHDLCGMVKLRKYKYLKEEFCWISNLKTICISSRLCVYTRICGMIGQSVVIYYIANKSQENYLFDLKFLWFIIQLLNN